MGGNLSFVIAMLDNNNSGFILDVVHSREGCYIYFKRGRGRCDKRFSLGGEEQEALEQALGYVKRPTMDEPLRNEGKGRKQQEERVKSGLESRISRVPEQ